MKPLKPYVKPVSILLGLLAFLFFGDIAAPRFRVVDELFDFGHIVLFAAVAFAVFSCLKNRIHKNRLNIYLLAGLAALSIGLITEAAQIPMARRQFQIGDLVHDALGVLWFLGIGYVYEKGKSRILLKAAVILVLLCILAVSFIPVAVAALDTYYAYHDFPIIGSFERHTELSRWSGSAECLERIQSHAVHGKWAMKVRLGPGKYPGFSSSSLRGDWRGFEKLSFYVFLEGPWPLRFTIRIHDALHNNEYSDRYNRSFELNPGGNQIEIPLREVARAPKDRNMDMERIENICMFAYELKDKRVLFVDDIRLKR